MHKTLRLLGAGAVLALGSGPIAAEAATTTTTFLVTANVSVTCSFTASDLDFGTYDTLAATALDATSTIQVTCTNGGTYAIGLNQGLHGGSVTTRKMQNNTSPTVFLNYHLYADSARTINWGNTVGTDTVGGTGSGTLQNISVFGKIPAAQTSATSGGYSDTITATLTF